MMLETIFSELVAAGLVALGSVILVTFIAPLEDRISARIQARVGSRTGPSGLLQEVASMVKLVGQRHQELPPGGRFWMIIWTAGVFMFVGLVPWTGGVDGPHSELALVAAPAFALGLGVCLHEVSPHGVASLIASAIPFLLAVLTAGLQMGTVGGDFSAATDLRWGALSHPSLALASIVYVLSGYAAFGQAPISGAPVRAHYKRGASGALLMLGKRLLRFGVCAQAAVIFFGGGRPLASDGPLFAIVLVLKSILLMLLVQFAFSALPKLRMDQRVLVGWGPLFFASIAAFLLRCFGL